MAWLPWVTKASAIGEIALRVDAAEPRSARVLHVPHRPRCRSERAATSEVPARPRTEANTWLELWIPRHVNNLPKRSRCRCCLVHHHRLLQVAGATYGGARM
jgi:hypothetical protein